MEPTSTNNSINAFKEARKLLNERRRSPFRIETNEIRKNSIKKKSFIIFKRQRAKR